MIYDEILFWCRITMIAELIVFMVVIVLVTIYYPEGAGSASDTEGEKPICSDLERKPPTL